MSVVAYSGAKSWHEDPEYDKATCCELRELGLVRRVVQSFSCYLLSTHLRSLVCALLDCAFTAIFWKCIGVRWWVEQ